MQSRVIVPAALLSIAVAGCVAYRGNAVPRIDPATIRVARMNRVMSYELSIDNNVGDEVEVSRAALRELEQTFNAAGAELKPNGSVAAPDSTLTVSVAIKGNVPAQLLSGFISGFTFCIVPAYAAADMRLEADVKTRDGAQKHYEYADALTVWIELFLLPFSNSPDRVGEELLADMFRSLARDMQRDGLLPAAMSAAISPSRRFAQLGPDT
jgi:hypothetical protein